ncbi:MAG: DEAD/DEAH box helicase family protein [Deltaproteobacteria bacterium]|nr:DEAD/DEAH box helicase family protein [Deltaproteobacteria bacterium]
MKIVISNRAFLQGVPTSFERELTSRLTFRNPAYEEAERMGRWLGDLDEYLRCYQNTRNGLIIPRGYARQLIGLCRRHGVRYHLEDQRRILPEVDFAFQGQLRPFQQEAVKAVLSRDFGVLSAPTGSGKTVMALHVIAERRQPALVIVHTKELLH